ncbi:hypothetical protein ACJX0J_016974, partial [Zea mays]
KKLECYFRLYIENSEDNGEFLEYQNGISISAGKKQKLKQTKKTIFFYPPSVLPNLRSGAVGAGARQITEKDTMGKGLSRCIGRIASLPNGRSLHMHATANGTLAGDQGKKHKEERRGHACPIL